MRYEGVVYRPPSEGRSLIVQVTIGCAHNSCTFCNMYKAKKFRVRTMEESMKDLLEAQAMYCLLYTSGAAGASGAPAGTAAAAVGVLIILRVGGAHIILLGEIGPGAVAVGRVAGAHAERVVAAVGHLAGELVAGILLVVDAHGGDKAAVPVEAYLVALAA